MGQQQLLLIVLSVILVSISFSVGITMFRTHSLSADKDAIVLDIINLSTIAYQYRLRPKSLGGGGGSYEDFDKYLDSLSDFADNDNGKYTVDVVDKDTIKIEGESNIYGGKILAYYDQDLNLITNMKESGTDSEYLNGYQYIGWSK